MDSTPDVTPSRSNKQSSSRHSMTSTEVSQDTSSSQSRFSHSTAADYRYRLLQRAQICIHGPPPPAEVQASIDIIVKAEISKQRQTELLAISQRFHEGCARVVKAAVSKDDCMDVLRVALLAMDHSKAVFRQKTFWQEELLPTILPFDFDLSFVHDYQQEVDDTSARPRKRQQQTNLAYISPEPSRTDTSLDAPGNNAYFSPETSKTTTSLDPLGRKAIDSEIMPPPARRSSSAKGESKIAKRKNARCDSHIKRPVPDMTIGIELEALVSALSSQNLDAVNVVRFLELLQTSRVRRQPNGPDEPILCVVPMQCASDLVFPFAVVEAKSYSTGRPIFEAQNQAGVSGACGLKILLCLDEIVNSASTSSHVPLAPSNALLFSICTEGPIHELWVHYTTIGDGVRKFNMRLLKTCNGMLPESVVDFFFAVDNVLGWGLGGFLDGVVDQLEKVARRGGERVFSS